MGSTAITNTILAVCTTARDSVGGSGPIFYCQDETELQKNLVVFGKNPRCDGARVTPRHDDFGQALMKHCVYYDTGDGQAALITAAIRLQMLARDLQPDTDALASFLRDHGQVRHQGEVQLLGERHGEKVYWVGLGKRSALIVVRAWRHFLSHYRQDQGDYSFYLVPSPRRVQWNWGKRMFAKKGQWHKRGSQWLAHAATRDYAVFLTVLMTDMPEAGGMS